MTLRHIALFRWIEGEEPELAPIRAVLVDLVNDHGDRLELGRSLRLSPSTFDFGLTADFDSETAYQSYRRDPRHQRLMDEVLGPASQDICAVQIDLA